LTKDLSLARTQNEVIEAAVANIRKYFNADVVVYLGEADGDIGATAHRASNFTPSAKEFSVAAWVYWNEKNAGKSTETLPFADATYFPMSGPRYPLGVIGVKLQHDQRLSVDQETLLENFIRQISSTIERELLNELTKKSIVLAESERLYSTLFNSISHELRTPISTIMGASENLSMASAGKTDEVSRDLAREIHMAADRLNRLIENLLDMTRLESGLIRPTLDWCDIHDLMSVAVKGLQKELTHHIVSVKAQDDVPLVKLDFGLVEQVLTNLIHNAAVHTPPGTAIEIEAHMEERELVITVADNGPGFPREAIPKAFEKFYRVPGTRTGGTGLGLTIAKGFVEAHRGKISVQNRVEGGAQFTVRLPVDLQETSTLTLAS
jgi:two-component system sensor histidine kinase KdpD